MAATQAGVKSVKDFLEQVKTNIQLQEGIKSCSSQDEIIALAKENSFEFTREDFEIHLQVLGAETLMRNLNLSEEELKNISEPLSSLGSGSTGSWCCIL